jgi:type I restriction-modification system DNA methylase subunit
VINMSGGVSGPGEHIRVMETRITEQSAEIERLRLHGQDTSEAVSRLSLLHHALHEMRIQLGHLSLNNMDAKRTDVAVALRMLSQEEKR